MSVTFHRLHVFAPGIHGVLIEEVPAHGPATAPAPGAGGMSAKGDAGGTDREATGDMLAASSDLSDPRTHHAGSTDGGSHEVANTVIKSSDNGQVLDVPSRADPGSAVEAGAQVSQSGASLSPDAPGSSPGPDPVETPGAIHSGEMPDLPDFLNRKLIAEAAA